MRTCVNWFTDPPWRHFEPPRLHWERLRFRASTAPGFDIFWCGSRSGSCFWLWSGSRSSFRKWGGYEHGSATLVLALGTPLKRKTEKRLRCDRICHKVLIYNEYRYHSICPLVGIGIPPPPLPLASVPPRNQRGGGGTLAYGWGSPNSDDGRKSVALCLLYSVRLVNGMLHIFKPWTAVWPGCYRLYTGGRRGR